MGDVYKSACGSIELRLGEWQDVLGDVRSCGSVITDPPYSEVTHAGRRTGSETRKPEIGYNPIGLDEIHQFATHWAEVSPRWLVVFGDDRSCMWWRYLLDNAGLYAFAQVPWVKPDAAPRMSGDGPASQAEYLSIARPRRKVVDHGSRPGYYLHPTSSTRGVGGKKGFPGQKPIGLMRALVRDYSVRGDLVVDPYAGSGTTLIAAAIEGRQAIGAERDPDTFALAVARLRRGFTPSFVDGSAV